MKKILFFIVLLVLLSFKQKQSKFEQILTNPNIKWVKSTKPINKSHYIFYSKFFPDYTIRNYYISNNSLDYEKVGNWNFNEKDSILKIDNETYYKIISFSKDSIELKEKDFLFKLYNYDSTSDGVNR